MIGNERTVSIKILVIQYKFVRQECGQLLCRNTKGVRLFYYVLWFSFPKEFQTF